MSKTTRCRSCHAEIVYAQTEAGKNMPVDVQPVPDGNVVLVDADPPTCWVVTAARPAPAGVLLRKSHFATCPSAPQWRMPETAPAAAAGRAEPAHDEFDDDLGLELREQERRRT